VSLIKQDNTTIQGTYTAPTSPVTSPVLDIPKEGIKSAGETTSNLTGIHWTSPVASALQEPVIEGAKAIPGLVAQAGTQAQDAYANMMRQAMGPEQYQKYINKLAQKNILQSSVAENVLSNAQQQTARSIADKAYQSKLAGTQAQIQAPGQLSGIIGQLGGTEAGTTRIGATKDPLEPYKVVGNLL
ncbi:MAG: hypothetical protein U9O94_03300, partial [Nanoarchaeota archaeon]|nr:hypothetical protein [Nanoarchaeota archaeon]